MGSKIFWHWAIAIISKKLVGNKLWNGGQLPNWPPPGYANDCASWNNPDLIIIQLVIPLSSPV
jgi:hypothetical protein